MGIFTHCLSASGTRCHDASGLVAHGRLLPLHNRVRKIRAELSQASLLQAESVCLHLITVVFLTQRLHETTRWRDCPLLRKSEVSTPSNCNMVGWEQKLPEHQPCLCTNSSQRYLRSRNSSELSSSHCAELHGTLRGVHAKNF